MLHGTDIKWYDTVTSTTPLATTDALINGQVYYASQTNATGCESALRLEVTVTIDAPLAPTGSQLNRFVK